MVDHNEYFDTNLGDWEIIFTQNSPPFEVINGYLSVLHAHGISTAKAFRYRWYFDDNDDYATELVLSLSLSSQLTLLLGMTDENHESDNRYCVYVFQDIYYAWHVKAFVYINGVYSSGTVINIASQCTKIKIKRSGTHLIGYYWYGGVWNALEDYDFTSYASLVNITYIRSSGGSAPIDGYAKYDQIEYTTRTPYNVLWGDPGSEPEGEKEPYDYLPTIASDVDQTLTLDPDNVFTHTAKQLIDIHTSPDGRYESRIKRGGDYKLVWFMVRFNLLSASDAGIITQYWYDENYGDGMANTFKFTFGGHTYVVRFDCNFEEAINPVTHAVPLIKFFVPGKIADS